MKHLLSLRYLTRDEIEDLLDLAARIKQLHQESIPYQPLAGKTVLTAFPPTSLRTRVSFEVGIYQLGAQALNMPLDFQGREPVEDKVGYLNNWIDYLVIRNPDQQLIEKIANLAEFSVVNAMSNTFHPCEILSDIMTLRELRGDLSSLKIVFVGEGANISNSWFMAAAKLHLNLTQVCPPGYEVKEELVSYAQQHSQGTIVVTNDMQEGICGADIILTDGWPSKQKGTPEFNRFLPYQITLKALKLADKDCLVNPCPPFTRGQEITEKVLASRHFVGYTAKENLLHMHKAILTSLT